MFQRPDPMTIAPDALGHRTRYSDSSLYDEKCVLCGGTDAAGDKTLGEVCLKADPPLDLMKVILTETVTTVVMMRGQDVSQFLADHAKAERHFHDQTPPLLPASASVVSTTRRAIDAKGAV